MSSQKIIGIVGATGVVGQTAIDLLRTEDFKFEIAKLKLYASKKSSGKLVSFNGLNVLIEVPTLKSLEECDAVLFASEASVSEKFIPELSKKGIYCIDKSSAFRMDATVPLMVPEVNENIFKQDSNLNSYIIASPNCVAIPLSVVADVVNKAFNLQKMIVSTYQSVSGTGSAAIDVLLQESKDFFTKHDLTSQKSSVYPKSIAFNVIPFIESLDEEGHTGEEVKIREETKKILHNSQLKIDVTSVRVPSLVGHAMSVVFETKNSFDAEALTAALKKVKGIQVAKPNEYMTPREVHGKNKIFVSRIRKSDVFQNGFTLWIACDNLRKGAALNALQIIETVLTKKQ